MMSALDGQQLDTGHLLTVIRDGVVVACLTYDWVSTISDCLAADRGEPTWGDVLYVSNMRITQPDRTLIFTLKRQLPPFRYIVGFDQGYHLIAPKGVPNGFLV